MILDELGEELEALGRRPQSPSAPSLASADDPIVGPLGPFEKRQANLCAAPPERQQGPMSSCLYDGEHEGFYCLFSVGDESWYECAPVDPGHMYWTTIEPSFVVECGVTWEERREDYATWCLSDAAFLRAFERLESERNLDRLPTSLDGDDYQAMIRSSIRQGAGDRELVYACWSNANNVYANYCRVDEKIHIHEAFWDNPLHSSLTGIRDWRASILVHEHAHRVLDLILQESAGVKEDMGLGMFCPVSEHHRAKIQAMYLGFSKRLAAAMGRIYARTQNNCDPKLKGAILSFAAMADFADAMRMAPTVGGMISVFTASAATASDYERILARIYGPAASRMVALVIHAE